MHQRICLERIPILTFHSVRARETESLGPGGELTLPLPIFERILRGLARAGFHTIRCADLYAHLHDDQSLPRKAALLTFDDGYLDNWTIVAPMLRRYGLRGTVFVATDLLEEDGEPRPTLETETAPPESGFMRPSELRLLDQEGVLEIQSHTSRHLKLPRSSTILDYRRPGVAEASGLPLGTPLPESQWSSALERAWILDPKLTQALRAAVETGGGEAFYSQPNWRQVLDSIVARPGWHHRQERPEEGRERIRTDLSDGKRELEGILGHEVPFLAWPGGSTCPVSLRMALQEIGFIATFGTDRKCAGITPDVRAIPRAYFRQTYRGRASTWLRAWHALGLAGFESGNPWAYPRLFAANRLMNLWEDPGRPNWN